LIWRRYENIMKLLSAYSHYHNQPESLVCSCLPAMLHLGIVFHVPTADNLSFTMSCWMPSVPDRKHQPCKIECMVGRN